MPYWAADDTSQISSPGPGQDKRKGVGMNCILRYLQDVILLPNRVRGIMATQDDIRAQQDAINSGLDNIAADVNGLKTKLDAALADTAGQVDSAVQAALQEVSDGLAPIAAKASELAASTPDDEPAPAPVEEDPFA